MASLIEIRNERLTKVARLRELGLDPYPSKSNKELANTEVVNNFEQYEGKELTLAGRLMSWRDMGEIAFGHIADESGQIQLYIHKDNLAPTSIDKQTIGR